MQELQTTGQQPQNVMPQSSTQLTTYQSETINKRVKALFINFEAVYGYRWTYHITNTQVLCKTISAWESAVSDLTDEQIHKAMRKFTRCEDWVSISGFRKAALGIVSPSRAYEMRESDPISKQVWDSIPSFDRNNRPETEIKQRFFSAYDILTEKMLLGEVD